MHHDNTPPQVKRIRDLLQWGPIDKRNKWRQVPEENVNEVLRIVEGIVPQWRDAAMLEHRQHEDDAGRNGSALRVVTDYLRGRGLHDMADKLAQEVSDLEEDLQEEREMRAALEGYAVGFVRPDAAGTP